MTLVINCKQFGLHISLHLRIKPHLHTILFSLTSSLVALLVRVYNEQDLFSCKFFLTSFICSCLRLDKFSLQWRNAQFLAQFRAGHSRHTHNSFTCSKSGMTSFWTSFLVMEKLVNLCCTHEQIKLVKGKFVKGTFVKGKFVKGNLGRVYEA